MVPQTENITVDKAKAAGAMLAILDTLVKRDLSVFEAAAGTIVAILAIIRPDAMAKASIEEIDSFVTELSGIVSEWPFKFGAMEKTSGVIES